MSVRLQLKFTPKEASDEAFLQRHFLKHAGYQTGTVVWVKKSLDSRGRTPIFLISADVYSEAEVPQEQEGFKLQNVAQKPEVHIIGAGPAGLYAALQAIELGFKPIIIERGKGVKERRRDLAVLNKEKTVNPDSNYCFGEGGAGTYSDGKLYTRSNKRGPVQKVLQSLVDYGAKDSILYEAHPHIGTNKLPGLVEAIRNQIVECGGEVRFDTKLVDFEVSDQKIKRLIFADGATESVDYVVLATGHSARDIFELLDRKKVAIESKPFALGVRMEHPQSVIDQIQYKCEIRDEHLPPSSYSLVEQINGRGVFSFCMCPGGIIAPAATSPGEVVVNGWSPSKRNGQFANSGFVVAVDDQDFKPFEKHGALRAMNFQKFWEQACFERTGSISAPAQRIDDFIGGRVSGSLPDCSYIPGLVSTSLYDVMPKAVSLRIKEALVVLGRKMPGLRSNEGILVGVESRTSSPVRIPRDSERLHHPEISNLYPCAEGAGYAGGIMSAALDGIRVLESISLCQVE